MQTTRSGRCHEPADDSYTTSSERGMETIELALVSAMFIVIVVTLFPLLANGVDAGFQSVIERFATANAGGS